MKFNNKGFSMVEIFAVIFIASVLIFPMMTTLVNNVEINDRIHARRSALSIAQGTLEGFNRMEFSKIELIMNDVENTVPYFVSFDATDFDATPPLPELSTEDIDLGNIVFSLEWNNHSFAPEQYKVFIIHFNIDTNTKNYLTGNSSTLPDTVKDEISKITPTVDPNPDLYYIYIWIEYDVDTSSSIVLGGLLSND